MMDHGSRTKAWFLGPKGENARVLEELITDVLRDHVFWRRNFHAEDHAVISERDKRSEAYEESMSLLRQELFDFLAKLKNEVPFFSPRYCAHMLSENVIPALVGYFATMLYNPNNVSAEASAVTTQLEIDVGRQLARMIGYDPAKSWGHLSSCGSTANFEALWVARNLKYLPIAARWVAEELRLRDGVVVRTAGGEPRDVRALGAWELLNVPPDECADLRARLLDGYVATYLGGDESAAHRAVAAHAVDASLAHHSIQGLGLERLTARMNERWPGEVGPTVVIVPTTKHYSWSKSVEALGLGRAQLRLADIGARFRVDVRALEKVLDRCIAERHPVIMLVSVLGSTELGVIDPIDRVDHLRREILKQGLSFSFHVDGAYGGYLLSVLYDEQGNRRSPEHVTMPRVGWPADDVHAALQAVAAADSVTIDPHKLGYVPYPAGALVFKDARVRDAIVVKAPYVFREADEQAGRDSSIGQYTLEGSKPGAAAAAVWFAHRIVPLNMAGYGQLVVDTARSARHFFERLLALSAGDDPFVFIPLCEPDTNLVCYLLNRVGNRTLAEMNRLQMRMFDRLSTRATDGAAPHFYISKTTLHHDAYAGRLDHVLSRAGIAGETFVPEQSVFPHEDKPVAVAPPGSASEVIVLRSTFMNPWFSSAPEGPDYYLDLMITELRQVAREVVRDELRRISGAPPSMPGR